MESHLFEAFQIVVLLKMVMKEHALSHLYSLA
jgi:hypothetical protein